MIVGNDIVDLELAGEPSPRFVARVLASEERRVSTCAADVWRRWAAKESAFKLLAQRDRDLAFIHSRFVVDTETGLVRHANGEVRVHWEQYGNALACIGWQTAGNYTGATATVEAAEAIARGSVLGAREGLGVVGRLSVAVRLLAKHLLCEQLTCSWTDVEILRPGDGPPEVWLGGRLAPEIGISLAHDGHFVACAFAFGTAAQGATSSIRLSASGIAVGH
jgi:phosphopantetheinyl transferase (holo-ACP synthase)